VSSIGLSHTNYLKEKTLTLKAKVEPLHGKALCCFTEHNKFRQFCYKMMCNDWFDRVILMFISISTCLLAFETPLTDPDSRLIQVLEKIDYFMTTIFLLEMLTKIFALGLLCNGKESYLRSAWNFLDFVIVLASVFSVLFSSLIGLKLSFLKALRMLRILRPLRLISRNKGLRLSLTALVKSIPKIVNLLLIVVFCLFLLAILGTTLFCGKFYKCHTEHLTLNI